MDLAFYARVFDALFDGLAITILLLVTSGIAGNLAAVVVALARSSKRAILRLPALVFIETIRGTPLIVQMFMIYYGLAQFREVRNSFAWVILKDPVWCAFIALTISTAAYSGEILRGAIREVPRGLIQAGQSLGMGKWPIRFTIILPLAYRQSIPVLANETVLLLKASAIVFTITVRDVMGEANIIRAQTFRVYEPLIAAALIYLALTFIIRRGYAWVERRFNGPRNGREPTKSVIRATVH